VIVVFPTVATIEADDTAPEAAGCLAGQAKSRDSRRETALEACSVGLGLQRSQSALVGAVLRRINSTDRANAL
jgi:hypothetical protein